MVRAASFTLALLLTACSAAAPSSSESPSADATAAPATSSAPSTSPSAAAEWEEPAAYSFTLESRCGERNLIGRFAVEVENGEVIAVEGLDEQGRTAATVVQPSDIPTLADLLALVAEAQSDGADKVTLATNPTDGHPISVEIDWQANADDDEECYQISDFVPAG